MQLGLGQVAQYAWYQALLRSGYLRWATRGAGLRADVRSTSSTLRPLLALPDRDALRQTLGESGLTSLLSEADEILSGEVRLFGGDPVSLALSLPGPLPHWTEYELRDMQVTSDDIKLVWEPGRFGWAYTLGRAYYLTGDERFTQKFWEYNQEFMEANPPYFGPHWVSAQEAAFRLIALTFCAQIFSSSPHSTGERLALLSQAVAAHAARIPPSLAYARAQNNNHLLGEAAGLYTAGLALPEHPQAPRWREQGWRWLHWGLQRQIDEDGAYVQHSSNYHRLMLLIALWVAAIPGGEGRPFPDGTRQRLSMATRWLLALVDRLNGQVPNLGPNDGAYLQPLTTCPFSDYRPALQAAASAFLDERPFTSGPWDELSLWLNGVGRSESQHPEKSFPNSLTLVDLSPALLAKQARLRAKIDNFLTSPPLSPDSLTPHVLRLPHHASWAYLRLAHFHSRPGHADQLHLDLWWHGLNLAQDAGSYSYNAPPPWNNSLSRTCAHNTLVVNGQDQMSRAGRFLWLDWAQAQLIQHEKADDGSWERLVARHDGYRRLGLLHQRSVTAYYEGRWLVEDSVLQVGKSQVDGAERSISTFNLPSPALTQATCLACLSDLASARLEGNPGERQEPSTFNLYWLLPDWKWEIGENRESRVEISLLSPFGRVVLEIKPDERSRLTGATLVRAGQVIYGSGDAPPYLGWVSPTYARKVPALSLNVAAIGAPPFSLTTTWLLPLNDDAHLTDPPGLRRPG
jgi:hypothetical protein